jgi:hypothetical protein
MSGSPEWAELKVLESGRHLALRFQLDNGPVVRVRPKQPDAYSFVAHRLVLAYLWHSGTKRWSCGDAAAFGYDVKDSQVVRQQTWAFGDHDTPDWVALARITNFPKEESTR